MLARREAGRDEAGRHRLDRVRVVPAVEPAADRRQGDLVAGPCPHRDHRRVVADRRPGGRAVDPGQERQERLGVEPLVVHGALVAGSLQQLGGLAGGRLDRLGQAEARSGDEEVGGVVRLERRADDPGREIGEGQGVARVLRAGGRLAVVGRPDVEVEDGQPGIAGDPEAELHRLREHDLLLGREERDAGDLAEIEPGRVLDVEEVVVLGRVRLVVGRGRRGRRVGRRRRRVGSCSTTAATSLRARPGLVAGRRPCSGSGTSL